MRGNALAHFPSFLLLPFQISLLVAFLAADRSFFHVGVAALAGFVCPVFAEAFNFTGALLMALLAVFQKLHMCFVVKLDTFFHVDYVSRKGCSSKSYHGNHRY